MMYFISYSYIAIETYNIIRKLFRYDFYIRTVTHSVLEILKIFELVTA
jgi:hypothetical protein